MSGFPLNRIIKDAREKAGLRVEELAARVGVTRAAIYQWESGATKPSRENIAMVAEVLKLPLDLFTGKGSHTNVIYANEKRQKKWVPLIDWVCAGRGASSVDPYPVGVGVDYIEVDVAYSDKTFALTVKGDSMEPRFSDGDTIIIDPAIAAKNEDFVIVELLPEGTPEGQGDITFKQMKLRTGVNGHSAFDLSPLNPQESAITVNAKNPGRIIGKVVEHRKKLP